MLPLFWKTRQRLVACVLVLLIFFISLASVLGELVPARASSPLWHNLQASLVRISNGPLPPFVPPATSTQTDTGGPGITPTDPPINQPGGYTPTPADSYPTSTDYPPITSTDPVANQPSYPVTQPTSRYSNGITPQPTPTKVPTTTPTQPAGPTPTPTAKPRPTRTPVPTDTPTLTPTDTPVFPVSCTASSPTPTATPTLPVTTTPTTPPATTAGAPALISLEQVTDGAFGQNNVYVPNSWGVQKSRIVRTSTGDIFAVYISSGTGTQDRTWHLMHRTPGPDGKWKEVQINSNNGTISNDAGSEPINILVGPADELHLFIWPGTQGKLVHIYSKDLGQSFDQEEIAGKWSTDQGYSGATIDGKGDMVIYQTAEDIPGHFLWSYYSASNKNWTFHANKLDCRYTYAFFFLGDNNDLTITAMRDVQRPELGLTASSGFDYIFNAIGYFYIENVAAPDPQMSSFFNVTEVQPKNNTDSDITYLTDSYVDTAGRVHILYNNMYDGPDELNGLHHAIIENGRLVYDELQRDGDQQPIELGIKARMAQDAQGHFYLITMDPSGNYLDVYPGTDSDTDGTQLEAAVKLNISRMPGCSDYDFCHSPTFTIPRSGSARSNVIDGVYGNFTREIYFQIDLRGQSIAK